MGILDMNEGTLYCKIVEIGHMYVQIGAPVGIELAACRISKVLKIYFVKQLKFFLMDAVAQKSGAAQIEHYNLGLTGTLCCLKLG